MQRRKLNHALRRAEPCICTSIRTRRCVRTRHPTGLDRENAGNRILSFLYKDSRGNPFRPERWDGFAPSQSQTSLQVKLELRLKSSSPFTSSQICVSLQAKRTVCLKSNAATASGHCPPLSRILTMRRAGYESRALHEQECADVGDEGTEALDDLAEFWKDRTLVCLC